MLVVDDDPAMARAMSRILSVEFHVVVALSGAEALASMRKDPAFDAIVTDVRMPDIDGPALFAAICAQWPSLAARVLFASGGELPDSLIGLEARVITKPFAVDALRESVRRMVRSPR